MSTVEEQEIRDRLRSALQAVTPGSPPAAAITGQGRGIRRRRWISAGAALAAVIGLGVALPGLVRAAPEVPAAAPVYHVTVNPPRPGAPRGQISSGTVNGRRWRVTVTGSGQNAEAVGPGLPYLGLPGTPRRGEDPVAFTSGSSARLSDLVGALRADVTYVTMRLPDGTLLTLRPVAAGGARLIAVVLPGRVRVTDVVAYGRAGKLAHAVPYYQAAVGNSVVTWLRPGQPGLPRASARIGSGTVDGQSWTAAARAGPWGMCLPNDCIEIPGPAVLASSAQVATIASCGPLGPGTYFNGLAVAPVRSLRLTLSDGSTQRLRPPELDGTRFFAFAVGKGVHVTRWRAYNAAGRQLRTGSGWGRCG